MNASSLRKPFNLMFQLAVTLLPCFVSFAAAGNTHTVKSPDGHVQFRLLVSGGQLSYEVTLDANVIVESSKLGGVIDGKSFGTSAEIIAVSDIKKVDEPYELKAGKQLKTVNHYIERTFSLNDKSGVVFDVVVRAYNDGVAFCYYLPTSTDASAVRRMDKESTEFAVPEKGKAWIFPYQFDDKTRKPSYEMYSTEGTAIRTPSLSASGFAFPMLFQLDNCWMLISEARLDGSYPACHITNLGTDKAYQISFPEPGESVYPDAPAEPRAAGAWTTPWRCIVVGTLAGIFETQMISHLNPPSVLEDESWIKAGRSSWSWWSEKVRSREQLERYVDLSVKMNWEYSLFDARWDERIEGVDGLIRECTQRGIGVWLWYASGAGTEKNPKAAIMARRESRLAEMNRISDLGVKGIKVDFFDTDKQPAINLYLDILQDAAKYHLMVDFHGCTVPRGWQRTYPHLLTMEAVKGAEGMGNQERCDRAPKHHTILAFTRNVVGSMDYTPVIFSQKNPDAKTGIPVTTYAHQLALSVVFESGLQCFADRDSSYLSLPDQPKAFLKEVPAVWDETRLLAGYPGKSIVVARLRGDHWYIAGINGNGSNETVRFQLPETCYGKTFTMIMDGKDRTSFDYRKMNVKNGEVEIQLPPNGGFAARI